MTDCYALYLFEIDNVQAGLSWSQTCKTKDYIILINDISKVSNIIEFSSLTCVSECLQVATICRQCQLIHIASALYRQVFQFVTVVINRCTRHAPLMIGLRLQQS